MGVYLWTDSWKPTADTIAYYKFGGNLNDSSGNNRNLSMYTGSFSYGTTSGGAKYIQTSSSNTANNLTIPINFDGYTVSGFVSFGELRSTGAQGIILDVESADGFPRFRTGSGGINSYCGGSHRASASTNTRYHLVCVIKNKIIYCYINGQLQFQDNIANYSGTTATLVLNGISDKSRAQYRMSGKMSELILENKAWTTEDIITYYNKNSENYGL